MYPKFRIFFREGGGAEGEGERESQADSLLLSAEPNSGLDSQPQDHDLRRNQESDA